jgi:RNA polymerase sigma factor (sigma-70 family)
MTREEERTLIELARAGDAGAFESLVLTHQKQVYNLALRMVGNEEDALDMSQEAFLRAYTSLEHFRGDSKFSVWLYRLTSNLCIDFIRSRKRRSAVSLGYTDENGEDQELEIPDLRFSPETELEKKELRRQVAAGLETLSPEYRQILILREINGLSYEEIGQALSLEAGTVKSRIFRARKRLCKLLSDSGNLSVPAPSEQTEKEV